MTIPSAYLQTIPFLNCDLTAHDFRYFPKHHSQLRYRELDIRRESQPMLFINHKLMPGSRKGAIETQLT